MVRSFFVVALLALPAAVWADAFDNYTNPILAKVPDAKEALRVKELTPEFLVEHSRALPGLTSTFLVVRTNEGRMSKLLVQAARHKVSDTESVPILLIERFVTFRDGEERAVHAQGQNVRLFDGFRFSLDHGQVVPESLGGDLRFAIEKDKVYTAGIGKAEVYLVTKHMSEANPKKGPKFVLGGGPFEPKYFTGKYKLYDDGRRTGVLEIKVSPEGDVFGALYSDKDGSKYDVSGKAGGPNHMIQFIVTFPRTIQTFQGWMFTGDGRVITGFSRMEKSEAGFYAVRVD